jgi:hypothetical protein
MAASPALALRDAVILERDSAAIGIELAINNPNINAANKLRPGTIQRDMFDLLV